MSLHDFERCTPSEFFAIYKAWLELRTQQSREEWERTRYQCLFAVQPHSSKRLTLEEIIRFPWEREPEEETPQLTPEERDQRYAAALTRYGLQAQDDGQIS